MAEAQAAAAGVLERIRRALADTETQVAQPLRRHPGRLAVSKGQVPAPLDVLAALDDHRNQLRVPVARDLLAIAEDQLPVGQAIEDIAVELLLQRLAALQLLPPRQHPTPVAFSSL